MATGDSADMLRRLVSTFPHRWTQWNAPIRNAILGGLADALAYVHSVLADAKAQGRLATASGLWLDLIAYDFFGMRVRRRASQSDGSLRATIKKEIFRERVTRAGIKAALEDLTGQPVIMFEPWNATDCGGLDTGTLGFDAQGSYGAIDMPHQIFVQVVEPVGAGIPNVGGFDAGLGGFDTAPGELGDQSQVVGAVTNQDIYDTVEATRPAGVTVWVAIGGPPIVGGRLDNDFLLDFTPLA